MATGFLLDAGRDRVEVRPGATVVCKRELELATVRVLLKPQRAGQPIAASVLEVRVDHGQDEDRQAAELLAMGGYPRQGVSLARGEREITLRLPVRRLTFVVHSQAGALLSDRGWAEPSPLAELEVTPVAGEVNTVEIEVAAPPPTPDPAKRR